jgi:hypothetical protein
MSATASRVAVGLVVEVPLELVSEVPAVLVEPVSSVVVPLVAEVPLVLEVLPGVAAVRPAMMLLLVALRLQMEVRMSFFSLCKFLLVYRLYIHAE